MHYKLNFILYAIFLLKLRINYEYDFVIHLSNVLHAANFIYATSKQTGKDLKSGRRLTMF